MDRRTHGHMDRWSVGHTDRAQMDTDRGQTHGHMGRWTQTDRQIPGQTDT